MADTGAPGDDRAARDGAALNQPAPQDQEGRVQVRNLEQEDLVPEANVAANNVDDGDDIDSDGEELLVGGGTILLSPWQGDIDLNTKAGKMLWDEGIKPLETKFSGYGKDLARFLADLKNRAEKCQWMGILTFPYRRTLLKNYGEITMSQVTMARDIRNATEALTLAQARPRINSLMMFYFLYDSLGPLPQKKLSTKLEDIQQDGPTLLKTVLDHTFVATQASTFTIKEKFYDLSLKKYKWNVFMLNQDVREKMADLEAAGHASDQTDVMISLFRAYNTSTNEEFISAVSFWKNE